MHRAQLVQSRLNHLPVCNRTKFERKLQRLLSEVEVALLNPSLLWLFVNPRMSLGGHAAQCELVIQT
jgi:hypothetical protein